MATSRFALISSKTDTSKPLPIVLIFRYKNSNFKYRTGFEIEKELWNQEKQQVRNVAKAIHKDQLNKQLSEIKSKVEKAYYSLIEDGVEINSQTLREKLSAASAPKKHSDLVVEFFETFISDAKNGKLRNTGGTAESRSPLTIKQWENTLQKIEAFQKYNHTKVRFADLDMQFHTNFLSFLAGELSLSDNTIGARIKDIKTISQYADLKGIEVSRHVFSPKFFKPSKKTIIVTLTESELSQIASLDLENNPRLSHVRDFILIGAWTGLRISDLKRFHEFFIEESCIVVEETYKTGVSVLLPIHPEVQKIIDRENGLPSLGISEQKFNDYIKEVCELAGINQLTKGFKKIKTTQGTRSVEGNYPKFELISAHSLRKSFATNLDRDISAPDLMALTGHKAESTLRKYTERKHFDAAIAVSQLWSKKYKQ